MMTIRDEVDDAAAAAEAFMQSLKSAPLGEPNLPSAGFLWLKAQVLQHQKLAVRAAEPMTFFQRISYLVIALCWAVVIAWKWPTILSLSQIDPGQLLELSVSGVTPSALMTMVIIFGLLSLTAALTLHSVFAGE